MRFSAAVHRSWLKPKLKEKQIIRVTAISTLDGEVIAEHTTEMVTDNIVKDIESRR